MSRDRDRGSATIEAIIYLPMLMVVALIAVLAGRMVMAQAAVEGTARDAARQASLARTPGQARADATALAADTLRQAGLSCTSSSISIDTSGFSAAVGRMGLVTANVSCTVRLSDLSIPGIPGSRTFTSGGFSSPIDAYRGRQ